MPTKRPVFTLEQLAVIAAWGQARPHGLRIDILGDHEELGDVAEVFRRDRFLPLYFVALLQTGAIEINPGDERRDEFDPVVVGDLGAALAMVERLERVAMGL